MVEEGRKSGPLGASLFGPVFQCVPGHFFGSRYPLWVKVVVLCVV